MHGDALPSSARAFLLQCRSVVGSLAREIGAHEDAAVLVVPPYVRPWLEAHAMQPLLLAEVDRLLCAVYTWAGLLAVLGAEAFDGGADIVAMLQEQRAAHPGHFPAVFVGDFIVTDWARLAGRSN